MTVKEWLNQGRNLDRIINDLIKEKDRALYCACRASMPYDGDGVQSSLKNTTENKFIQYSDYSKKIDEEIERLLIIKQDILQVINAIDNSIYKDILIKRYLLFYSWEKIAEEMHYSRMQINRLHGIALQKIKMLHNVTSTCDNM